MRKYTIAHSFLMISCVLASKPFRIVRRQGTTIIVPSSNAPAQTTPAQTTAITQQPSVTTPASTISTSPASTTSQSTSTPISTQSQSASSSASSSVTSASSAVTTPSATLSSSDTSTSQDTISSSISTDAAGSTIVVTVPQSSADSTSSSASPSPTGGSQDNSIHPGTIIGLSVAGGIAAIAIIAFIVWKLTRKRFSDLDDPDEAIKWPELNRDSHVGGASDGLSREVSNTFSSGTTTRNASALDQSEFADPYAVPPLPQFNPNQPYRDDPYAASGAGYYDPYRGPVPQTLHEDSVDGHESIPMSTYPPSSQSRSPGPGPAYDGGGRGSPAPGRASPGPGSAYDMGGRGSPAPGRTISPGPAAGFASDRRPSPGPQYALSGHPEMAARMKSPAPNVFG